MEPVSLAAVPQNKGFPMNYEVQQLQDQSSLCQKFAVAERIFLITARPSAWTTAMTERDLCVVSHPISSIVTQTVHTFFFI